MDALYIFMTVLLKFSSAQWNPPNPRISPQIHPPNATVKFGDMALTPEQEAAWKLGPVAFNAIIGEKYRWKDAIIPYTIDCSIENFPSSVAAVKAAMAQWERKTCMRFVKWTNQKFHLTFFRDTHCWGNVGQVSYSHISVGPGCDFEHVMAHEIGHVVGLYHEQNRKDRDEWVKVLWENIGQFKDAFDIVTNTDALGIPYDYESIMHYPWTAFSINGKPTMQPIRDTKGKVPYIEISKDDIRLVSKMYNCPLIEQKRNELSHRTRERALHAAPNKFDRFDCIDRHKDCEDWAKDGDCQTSESVREACKRSCRAETCYGGPCTDLHALCPEWKKWGHCRFVDVVQADCQKSCNPVCQSKTTPRPPPTKTPKTTTTKDPHKKKWHSWPNYNYLGTGFRCFDGYKQCPEWAEQGECERNKNWMEQNCRNSCPKSRCDRTILRPPGACTKPLGLSVDLEGNYKIPDSAMTATSTLSPGGGWKAEGRNARLYFADDYTNHRIGSWCAGNRNPQHVDVDLGETKTISYIATQGRPNYFERISKFKIEYSNDGTTYTTFKENGKDREFFGNCDHETPVLNKFDGPFKARYIRYVPLTWNWPCLRMEFYGC